MNGAEEASGRALEQRAARGRCAPERSHQRVLLRSTGLGNNELAGKIVGIKPQGDYLIMEIDTTEPVRWKVRGAVSYADLKALFRAMLRLSVGLFFLRLAAWFREPRSPGEF